MGRRSRLQLPRPSRHLQSHQSRRQLQDITAAADALYVRTADAGEGKVLRLEYGSDAEKVVTQTASTSAWYIDAHPLVAGVVIDTPPRPSQSLGSVHTISSTNYGCKFIIQTLPVQFVWSKNRCSRAAATPKPGSETAPSKRSKGLELPAGCFVVPSRGCAQIVGDP